MDLWKSKLSFVVSQLEKRTKNSGEKADKQVYTRDGAGEPEVRVLYVCLSLSLYVWVLGRSPKLSAAGGPGILRRLQGERGPFGARANLLGTYLPFRFDASNELAVRP